MLKFYELSKSTLYTGRREIILILDYGWQRNIRFLVVKVGLVIQIRFFSGRREIISSVGGGRLEPSRIRMSIRVEIDSGRSDRVASDRIVPARVDRVDSMSNRSRIDWSTGRFDSSARGRVECRLMIERWSIDRTR